MSDMRRHEQARSPQPGTTPRNFGERCAGAVPMSVEVATYSRPRTEDPMHDPSDEALDATAPATRFGIDFGPSTAPRQACIALASGRRYHLEVGADGHDHLLVTRADGREVARAVFDDAGSRPAGAQAARGTRFEEDTTAKVATADADSGQEVTWDVPRPTWAQAAEALPTPRLSLECFAAISAELHAFPERGAALLRRYGFVDHAELVRTERAWFARMTSDEVLQRRWRDLYEVCSRWLAVVGR